MQPKLDISDHVGERRRQVRSAEGQLAVTVSPELVAVLCDSAALLREAGYTAQAERLNGWAQLFAAQMDVQAETTPAMAWSPSEMWIG